MAVLLQPPDRTRTPPEVSCRAMLVEAFSGVGGSVFLSPKPSFPDVGVFDPCTGRTNSQGAVKNRS